MLIFDKHKDLKDSKLKLFYTFLKYVLLRIYIYCLIRQRDAIFLKGHIFYNALYVIKFPSLSH